MKLEVTQLGIRIIPENAQDIVYVEHYLKLQKDGDSVKAKRVNASSLTCIAYIEIRP